MRSCFTPPNGLHLGLDRWIPALFLKLECPCVCLANHFSPYRAEFLVPDTLPGAGNLFLKMGPVPGACCLPPGHETPPACKISQPYLLPASRWVPTVVSYTTSFCSHSLQRPHSVSQSVPALSKGLSVCSPGACSVRVGTPSPRILSSCPFPSDR